MRRTLSLVLSLLALCAAATAVPAVAAARSGGPHRCAGADRMPSKGRGVAVRRSVLCLVNRERTSRGLRSLRSNARLRRAAVRHSAHMARAKFFDHTTPSGTSMSSRILHSGYARGAHGWAIGENIAWGTGGRATPRQIVIAWMASPGHRANILDHRYREIGVGVALGAPVRAAASAGGATFTTDFGVRR